MKSVYFPGRIQTAFILYSIGILTLIIVFPLSSIFIRSFEEGLDKFAEVLINKRVLSSFRISFQSAFIASILNLFLGTILSWTLVRYEFPGKKILDAMIDLPLALPTSIAGLSFVELLSSKNFPGYVLKENFHISLLHTPFAIVLVLMFVSFPFSVRTTQSVLKELDKEQELAAKCLGANDFQIFRFLIFPEMLPSLLVGFAMSFARGIGEYGSVIFVAGNLSWKTEILPILISIRVEELDYTGASILGVSMLIISFIILLSIHLLERRLRGYASK